jgi:hypothetical protein
VEVDWKQVEQKKAEREQEKRIPQWWRAGSGTKAQEGEV